MTFNQVDIDYSSKVEKYKELLDSYNFILDKIKLILKNLDILEKKDISYIDSVKIEFEKLVKKYIVNKKKIEDEIIKINSINDIIREQEDIIQNIKTDEDKKFEVYKNAKNKLIDCIAGLIKLQDKIKEYTPNIIPEVYQKLLQTNAEKINENAANIEKIAITETFSVGDKVKDMYRALIKYKKFTFNKLFTLKKHSKNEVVTAFTGLLEMSRRNKVVTEQDVLFEDIEVEK